MDQDKIAKLRALGDMSFTAASIADAKEKIAAGNPLCVTVCVWIIQHAASAQSCVQAEVLLGGIFTMAEVAFPEAEEILIPLEVTVEGGWATACAAVGLNGIESNAQQWAETWCGESN